MARPVKTASAPRRYDSSRRREQARETQLRILRAARRLFIETGYGRTTMAEVAREAGVSVETVYTAFKNKPTLLHRVWDITVGGDDDEVLLHERPEVAAIRAEPDLATRFVLHARFSATVARRMAPFIRALQGAAGSEPAAAAMLEEIDRQRLAGLSVMAAEAASTGQLAVSEEHCRDFMWATVDGALWHRLVVERGWSDEEYADWLGRLWVHLLVKSEFAVRESAL